MLMMAVWNCDGTLWSGPWGLSETFTDLEMIFYVETHESPERGLPIAMTYTWEITYRRDEDR